MTRRSWLIFAAMCIIWGIPYLLIRVAVRDVTPGTLVFARTAIGGVILLPLVLRAGGFGPVLRRWRPLVAFTIIEMAVPWLLLSDAETKLSSSLAGLLVAAVPLVGVFVARLVGAEERVDGARLTGLLLGVVGVATLVGLDFGRVDLGALLEIAVVVIGYAVAPVILARRLADLPIIPVVSASLLMTAIGYLPYAVLRPPHSLSGEAIGSILVLGTVCTALAFVLFFALISAIGPARATVITYVNPAVAVLLGVTLLGERFTLGMAVGFPLILAGSVLAARRAVVRAAAAEPVALVAGDPPQSIRTSPEAVSNTAAMTPVPCSDGSAQSTSTSSRGC
ncbi:MAG: EamA family transporter [Pseudonocardiales bacterium]|nr:MAG: EamA family transporter [Pseudonocardiales bacterium]